MSREKIGPLCLQHHRRRQKALPGHQVAWHRFDNRAFWGRIHTGRRQMKPMCIQDVSVQSSRVWQLQKTITEIGVKRHVYGSLMKYDASLFLCRFQIPDQRAKLECKPLFRHPDNVTWSEPVPLEHQNGSSSEIGDGRLGAITRALLPTSNVSSSRSTLANPLACFLRFHAITGSSIN